ncbi:phosphatidylinositol-4- kinase [Lobulomyces angularis]|nr:phosphatidylinositol-4- kinase [Lobulomyces angularis]
MLKKIRKRQLDVIKPNTHYLRDRDLYAHIYPNHTHFNIISPANCLIRKFTPDGKFLVCFSERYHGIQLYAFKGLKTSVDSHPSEVWQTTFDHFCSTTITFGNEQLCKDFCLFTNDNKYIILASAVQAVEAVRRRNSLLCIDSLDDVSFHILEISSGKIIDKKTFNNDYIYLTNHAGVHLFNDILAITSIQNQEVHMLQIKDGNFFEVRTIGYHNNEDDDFVLAKLRDQEEKHRLSLRKIAQPRRSSRFSLKSEKDQVVQSEDSEASPVSMQDEPTLCGLKQRLMTFLYRKALVSGSAKYIFIHDTLALILIYWTLSQLAHFALTFDLFASLVMWRVHFLDEAHLMFKFGTIDNIMYRNNPEPVNGQTVFFVIYSLISTRVIGVYESSSLEFLKIYEKSDCFRGLAHDEDAFLNTTFSNNKYARDIVYQHMYTVKKARNGGAVQAVKRVLATLPLNPQSFFDGPYFDHNIYHFDDKVINSIDRSRICTDFPVKFYSRESGELKFQLDSNPKSNMPQPLGTQRSNKKLVSYVFHPTLPFIISTQFIKMSLNVVNFHQKVKLLTPQASIQEKVDPLLQISNRLDSNLSFNKNSDYEEPNFIENVLSLASTLFVDAKISRENAECVKLFLDYFLSILENSFELKCDEDCTDIWDSLLKDQKNVTLKHVDPVLVDYIFDVCWKTEWKEKIQIYWKEDLYLEYLSVILKLRIYCSFHKIDVLTVIYNEFSDMFKSFKKLYEDNHPIGVILHIVEALGIFAQRDEELLTTTIQLFLNFLTEPADCFMVFSQDDTESVIQCVCVILSTICQNSGNSAVSKSALFTLINIAQSGKLLTTGTNEKNSYLRLRNSFTGISFIAPTLKTKDAVIVFPVFSKYLEESDRQYDELIWEALGNIALLTDDISIYDEVVTLVLERCRKSFIKLTRISRTLARVTGKPAAFRDLYLRKIIALLIDRAETSLKQTDTSSLDEVKEVAYILKYLCDQIATEMDPQKFTSSLEDKYLVIFRNLWIYIIVTILPNLNGSWTKDWTHILSSVAAVTPALLLTKDKKQLEADLLSNSAVGVIKLTEPAMTKLRGTLLGLLPSKTNEVKGLSPALTIYLLAVYNLELFRVWRKFNVDYVLQYTTDDRNSDAADLLESIADEILKFHLTEKSLKHDVNSIQSHLKSLIKNSAHFMIRVRRFCSAKIDEVIAEYPQMLWNKYLVHLMIDLLRFLDCTDPILIKQMIKKNDFFSSIKFVDLQDQKRACEDFRKLSERWLFTGLNSCPKEIGGLFQSYTSQRFLELFTFITPDDSNLASLFKSFYSNQAFASSLVSSLIKQGHYIGEIRGMIELTKSGDSFDERREAIRSVAEKMKLNLKNITSSKNFFNIEKFTEEYSGCLHRAGAVLLLEQMDDPELLSLICNTNVLTRFNIPLIETSVSVWSWVMSSDPSVAPKLFAKLIGLWEFSAIKRLGLYEKNSEVGPFYSKFTYSPSVTPSDEDDPSLGHLVWIEFLHERLLVLKHGEKGVVDLLVQLVSVFHSHMDKIRLNITSRSAFFSLLSLMFKVLLVLEKLGDVRVTYYRYVVYSDSFLWFSNPPAWGKLGPKDRPKMREFYNLLSSHVFEKESTFYHKVFQIGPKVELQEVQNLLKILMENELNRAITWANEPNSVFIQENLANSYTPAKWASVYKTAWAINPSVAMHLSYRYIHTSDIAAKELADLIICNPTKALHSPYGVSHLISKSGNELRFLLMWAPISPVEAVCLLGPNSSMHPWIVQYAIRVLEFFEVEQVFFYIPQIVQSLRYDTFGYIEKYVLETARSSQLFAHQIIWNMNANMYRDEEQQIEDPLKPTLDRIIKKIKDAVSGADREFFEREFGFFSQVTGISGALKQYLHCSKQEKKMRIDEEMAKIKVDVGVYLPSNPESIVVGIDYHSGRPLQSHAKTPFMATFQIKKATEKYTKRMSILSQTDKSVTKDAIWQQCIFKVGDDCRQDILALQLISIFKCIFEKAGLDMYLFPYRIVATNPGCGVIEVIPNSISRDQMGREKVNSLYEYFVAHFGTPNGMNYQQAQLEFLKSLAPYSLIIYLLQIKDRHNGNIMFDSQGHIIHIDFGFILDLYVGGVNFESAPFKLTTEMIQVLGGDSSSPAYQRFSDLIVKAYLACRPYANEIISMVSLMADSGLPPFKGGSTIERLRERFQLEKTEKLAAEFMILKIKESHENTRSKLYDGYQFLTNGIPH